MKGEEQWRILNANIDGGVAAMAFPNIAGAFVNITIRLIVVMNMTVVAMMEMIALVERRMGRSKSRFNADMCMKNL